MDSESLLAREVDGLEPVWTGSFVEAGGGGGCGLSLITGSTGGLMSSPNDKNL